MTSAVLCFPAPNICPGARHWRLAVDHVSLDVRAGEIFGIYGLMGAGRSELLECIIGRHDGAHGPYCCRRRGCDTKGHGRRELQPALP